MPLSVMVNAGRRGQVRQIVKVLARVFVSLHVARGRGQQLFSCFTVIGEARNAKTDANRDLLAGTH